MAADPPVLPAGLLSLCKHALQIRFALCLSTTVRPVWMGHVVGQGVVLVLPAVFAADICLFHAVLDPLRPVAAPPVRGCSGGNRGCWALRVG